jgi:hypothetical protein
MNTLWRKNQENSSDRISHAWAPLKVHLHHFSKVKSQKEVTKQWESRFFLLFLLDDRRVRIRIRIKEAKKQTDLDSDPDAQHFQKLNDFAENTATWACTHALLQKAVVCCASTVHVSGSTVIAAFF